MELLFKELEILLLSIFKPISFSNFLLKLLIVKFEAFVGQFFKVLFLLYITFLLSKILFFHKIFFGFLKSLIISFLISKELF